MGFSNWHRQPKDILYFEIDIYGRDIITIDRVTLYQIILQNVNIVKTRTITII